MVFLNDLYQVIKYIFFQMLIFRILKDVMNSSLCHYLFGELSVNDNEPVYQSYLVVPSKNKLKH